MDRTPAMVKMSSSKCIHVMKSANVDLFLAYLRGPRQSIDRLVHVQSVLPPFEEVS